MMKKIFSSALAAFMLLSSTALADEAKAPLSIAEQGMFSAGGTITEPVAGDYDPTTNWLDTTRAGNTAHVDHANVLYQIPANDNGHPIVYLHGMSGGGETGSLVLGTKPELFTAYLATSSQWDGDLNILAQARTPVYFAIGEQDSYYGSESFIQAYNTLHELYVAQGLTEEEIGKLIVLDVKPAEFFTERGFRDQHSGGQAFAHEESVMGWLFGEH